MLDFKESVDFEKSHNFFGQEKKQTPLEITKAVSPFFYVNHTTLELSAESWIFQALVHFYASSPACLSPECLLPLLLDKIALILQT